MRLSFKPIRLGEFFKKKAKQEELSSLKVSLGLYCTSSALRYMYQREDICISALRKLSIFYGEDFFMMLIAEETREKFAELERENKAIKAELEMMRKSSVA